MSDDEIDSELAALYEAERTYEGVPVAGAEARVLAAVRARLFAPGGPDGSGPAAPPATGPGSIALPRAIMGMIATGILGAAIGATIVKATLPPIATANQAPVAFEVAPSVAPSGVTPLTPFELPDAPAQVSHGAPPPGPAASVPVDARGLAAERALLDAARVALGRGEPDAALDAVARHAREFPNGRLTEEREALAVRALAKAGRVEEARARGVTFLEKYPRSLAGPAVRAAMGTP